MSLEALSLAVVAKLFDKVPSIKKSADSIRVAMTLSLIHISLFDLIRDKCSCDIKYSCIDVYKRQMMPDIINRLPNIYRAPGKILA